MKVGVIGASFAQAAFLPALGLIEDVEVSAIASARLEKAQSVAAQFAIPQAYDDWRQMLSDHRFDLVCIATPTVLHAPMTLAALEAGAHVLCEKPTAMNAAEAEAMLSRAESLRRLHMIDHELRFNPKRRHIKRLIDSGAVGTLRHVVVTGISASWADPASRPEGDWWSLEDQGGGRLGANGSHQIDLLRWWFGEIAAVSGQIHTMVPARIDKATGRNWTATADDVVQFTAEFIQGGLATVLISTVAHHGARQEVQIFGSAGSISLSNDTEILMYGAAGGPFTEIEIANPYADLPGINAGIWNQGVVGALIELCAAIRAGRPLREGATFLDGLRNQRVMDAVRKSSQERRWISLAE